MSSENVAGAIQRPLVPHHLVPPSSSTSLPGDADSPLYDTPHHVTGRGDDGGVPSGKERHYDEVAPDEPAPPPYPGLVKVMGGAAGGGGGGGVSLLGPVTAPEVGRYEPVLLSEPDLRKQPRKSALKQRMAQVGPHPKGQGMR